MVASQILIRPNNINTYSYLRYLFENIHKAKNALD